MTDYLKLKSLLTSEILELDKLMTQVLISECTLLNSVSKHIFSAGKRLRPMMLLLMAKLFSYQGDNHIKFAAVMEIIHTATLLHDDVIDNSTMRRNQVSAHIKWGTRNSIIAGDWLFALAYEIACSTKCLDGTKIIAGIAKEIVDGELRQLLFKNKLDLSEDNYYKIIEAKTGLLFAGATELAANITNQSIVTREDSRLFGLHYGIAFQIQDDLLDYLGDSNVIGKNIGDDLLEGKLTLPLIYYKQRDKKGFKSVITKLQQNNFTEQDFKQLKDNLFNTDCITDCQKQIIKQQDIAQDYLAKLPQNDYSYCLSGLTSQIVARQN